MRFLYFYLLAFEKKSFIEYIFRIVDQGIFKRSTFFFVLKFFYPINPNCIGGVSKSSITPKM